jgi:mannitol/fructose-specific phosphotransferase system IIA component (Ntr-type)
LLLTDLLTIDRIKIPLNAATKDDVLRELVQVIGSKGVDDPDELLRAVREREAVLSTGIGNGVAIPHGKSSQVPDLVMAAGRTAGPVEFDSLDGQPVQLLFMLIGPETAAGPHIKALSRISRLIRKDSVRETLVNAKSAEEFFQALKEAEANP